MDTVDAELVGIVLAAGAGRRMGGPKALVGPLAADGVPLEIVSRWVHQAGIDRVVCVVGAEADTVRAALEATRHPWLTLVEAHDWASGMGASLRTGLAAASELGAEVALITLVDLPDVRTDVYRRVARSASGAATLARAAYDGRPGHPVLIGRDHWDAVASVAVGDQGARGLFRTTPHTLIECGDLATGVDADRPESSSPADAAAFDGRLG